ncbi:hypothetical protein PR048_003132 [Dryococelus australis]|uniref:Uncharacterized protein n=1 Tax=Dryococelus australis TaxID=614101 RepID=A0ABQ9IM90_9NEOP|nr:hypothetical protein PR048_003132 [Dryococelus australis]
MLPAQDLLFLNPIIQNFGLIISEVDAPNTTFEMYRLFTSCRSVPLFTAHKLADALSQIAAVVPRRSRISQLSLKVARDVKLSVLNHSLLSSEVRMWYLYLRLLNLLKRHTWNCGANGVTTRIINFSFHMITHHRLCRWEMTCRVTQHDTSTRIYCVTSYGEEAELSELTDVRVSVHECEIQYVGSREGSRLAPTRIARSFQLELFRLAVVELLTCSPPTKANRVQSPAGSLPDFRKCESCWTGISRFPRPSIPALLHISLHPHRFSRPRRLLVALFSTLMLAVADFPPAGHFRRYSLFFYLVVYHLTSHSHPDSRLSQNPKLGGPSHFYIIACHDLEGAIEINDYDTLSRQCFAHVQRRCTSLDTLVLGTRIDTIMELNKR